MYADSIPPPSSPRFEPSHIPTAVHNVLLRRGWYLSGNNPNTGESLFGRVYDGRTVYAPWQEALLLEVSEVLMALES